MIANMFSEQVNSCVFGESYGRVREYVLSALYGFRHYSDGACDEACWIDHVQLCPVV